MPMSAAEVVARAKASVSTIPCEEAARRVAEEPNLLLLDVREPAEHARGAVQGAVNLPRGLLELRIGELARDADRPILIHCAGGGRAALAAATLREMGYGNVVAVDGAFDEFETCCARRRGAS